MTEARVLEILGPLVRLEWGRRIVALASGESPDTYYGDIHSWCGCATAELEVADRVRMAGDPAFYAPADRDLRFMGVAFTYFYDEGDWQSMAETLVCMSGRADDLRDGHADAPPRIPEGSALKELLVKAARWEQEANDHHE